MAPNDEPKMDELKRLLRRLDGLEANKSAAKAAPPTAEERRDYVGALRGAPDLDEPEAVAPVSPAGKMSAGSAMLLAVAAALFSTLAVYLVMSGENRSSANRDGREAPASDRVVPSSFEVAPGEKRSEARGMRTPAEIAAELVARAGGLRERGDVEAARELLKQAADLGSGLAALELARSYDPAHGQPTAAVEGEVGAALARAWYERARALGVNETASDTSAGNGR